MSTRATIMGTACVFAAAALTASPAAAGTLTGFAGSLTTNLSSADSEAEGADTVKSWLLGGSLAGPLPDIANLNFQGDASYRHNWDNDFSREDWNFGASVFWAGDMGRIGINGNYGTFNTGGQVTNGGLFGEWYAGAITAMAKGGWLSSAGRFGGHGNYWGGGVTGYLMPNLAITGGVEWSDIVTGEGCRLCGRRDLRVTDFAITAEYLFSDVIGLSGYIGYVYQDSKVPGFDDDGFFNDFPDGNPIYDNANANIWRIGLRWYTGGGPLVDRHRNGNLNPWLPGIGPLQGHR